MGTESRIGKAHRRKGAEELSRHQKVPRKPKVEDKRRQGTAEVFLHIVPMCVTWKVDIACKLFEAAMMRSDMLVVNVGVKKH
ncbi:hypothetical protein NDU88_010889 [Pleurodeles waltl]|uniref:Uncharacterized protein n=1 Tax=Pleurodeles waltl TaxID=8319 RepID=A0AAV7S4N2_PLEWA|nr:hypothetical protein NDU88_010889 [Pleurodeles waltl]